MGIRVLIAPFAFLLALAPASRAQWQMQTSNATADLRGIDNVGGGVAWASGTNGTVLRTEDGGYMWQGCSMPPGAEKLDFRGVQGFDANTAIVMSSGKGDLSRLYKTTDGCHTWKLIFTNPDKDGFWDAISLRITKKDALGHLLSKADSWGYVLGDPVSGRFAIFETRDGGETWSRKRAAARGSKGAGCKVDEATSKADEAVFAASNQSLLTLSGDYFLFVTGGSVSRLAYSDTFSLDGALCHESVHSLNLPFASGIDSAGAFALAAMPGYQNRGNYPDMLVIVGGNYKQPDKSEGTAVTVQRLGMPLFQIARTPSTPPHGYRSSVAYDEKLKVWITVGPNGTDISTDDGKNWRAIHPNAALHELPDADRNWNAISLPYVVGPKGRIGRLDEVAIK